MMRKKFRNIVLFLLIFLQFSFVFAQSNYEKNYFQSGQLKSEGWVTKGKKNGYWKFYSASGQLEKEGHFTNDKAVKYWFLYHSNGIVKAQGELNGHDKIGWWLFYINNGKLSEKVEYKLGKKHGYSIIYNAGKIVRVDQYENGTKVNEWHSLEEYRNSH